MEQRSPIHNDMAIAGYVLQSASKTEYHYRKQFEGYSIIVSYRDDKFENELLVTYYFITKKHGMTIGGTFEEISISYLPSIENVIAEIYHVVDKRL